MTAKKFTSEQLRILQIALRPETLAKAIAERDRRRAEAEKQPIGEVYGPRLSLVQRINLKRSTPA